MAKRVLKSVGVLSLAKVYGVIMALTGLVFGVIYGAILALVGSAFRTQEGGAFMIFGGLFSVVLLPVIYGVFGFIFGALMAFIFNLVSGVIGGLEFEVEDSEPQSYYQTPPSNYQSVNEYPSAPPPPPPPSARY